MTSTRAGALSTTAPAAAVTARTRPVGLIRASAALAARDYRALYTWPVLAGTVLPRVLLQVAFLGYVGEAGGGPAGRSFALVGACVQVAAIATLVRGPTAVLEDLRQGTLFRLRLGRSPLLLIMLSRSWVFAAEAFAESTLAILTVVPVLGPAGLLGALLPALPLIALAVVTTTALGMVIVAASLFLRNEVVLANLASYLLLAVGGVVFPLGALPAVLQRGARLLPLTNALLGVRAVVAGGGWAGDALREMAVGVGWLILAALLLRAQDHRARRLGTDDLF